MDNGIKVNVQGDFGVSYEIGEKDKSVILGEFGKLFHKCAQMMPWFDNAQVEAKDKLEYWGSFYNMFVESIPELITMMLKAGITETQIMEQLNIPF